MAFTAWLELIIIALAMIIVPFVLWIVHQLRQSILSHVNLILTEYYTGLESQIQNNRNELAKLTARLKHRAEIASLKYNALADKIEEIENFLEKMDSFANTYHKRNRIRPIESKDVDILGTYHDNDNNDDDISLAFLE